MKDTDSNRSHGRLMHYAFGIRGGKVPRSSLYKEVADVFTVSCKKAHTAVVLIHQNEIRCLDKSGVG